MREKSERLLHSVDWFIVIIFVLLVIMGWFNIYSAVYDEQKSDIFNFKRLESKQLMFAVISIVLAFSIMVIDASFFTATAFYLYGGVLLLNIIVAFAGADIKGSRSWFKMGGFSFQPAEFAKWATALALAKFLSGLNRPDLKKALGVSLAIIGIPVFIMILLQRETGVALVFGAMVLVLYREGLIAGWILLIGLASVLMMVFGIKYGEIRMLLFFCMAGIGLARFLFLRKKTMRQILLSLAALTYFGGIMFVAGYAVSKMPDHQAGRIKVWLGLPVSQEIQDRYGYNTKQSLIAIGSGGMEGKGYLDGTQTKFRFVPEQETDFIFCTVGEEWGFVGSTAVVLLYSLLIIRIIILSERQRSDFTRIYGYAVAGIFLFHLLVNVGMTIGILPVIGIPLPFFSYGGSSLISFTILLAIFVKLDSQRLLILR